jgi:dTDP-4-dehydrorhamnose 3,5-epimerase-like enzyme
VIILPDRGDVRGGSWSVPVPWSDFLPAVRDLHVTTLVPGGVRGNHFHLHRREAIVVMHMDAWTLVWDEGPGTTPATRVFGGPGAVLILVEPGAAHAVANTGTLPLHTLGLTDAPFDPRVPDTHPRPLFPTG